MTGVRRLVVCGRIGAIYGVLAGCLLAVVQVLAVFVWAVFDWPKGETLGGLSFGLFSLLFFGFQGTLFGSVSGLLFGILGAAMNRPGGWVASGLLAGVAFAGLESGLLRLATRHPVPPADGYAPFWGISAFHVIWFGALGFVVSIALRTGKPDVAGLDTLRGPLRPDEQNAGRAF